MKRVVSFFLSVAIATAAGVGIRAAPEEVRISEGKRTILTGPFLLRGPSPQERPDAFRPVEYPAVFLENEYLRCCLLPTVGGRLYEVFHKASNSPVFFVNPFLETHPDDCEGGHPWNLGGVEVNFPCFHHGNTYNDRWSWAPVRRADGSAGVAMGFTSRPSMQRALFRVLLRPGAARIELEYRFENRNPYAWGFAAWIDTMHPKTMETQFILPVPWVAGHGHNVSRTKLEPWPIRDGVDLSWQKNVPAGMSLSEFAFQPRVRFHGCYEHATDRGAVRIFDPATLPAAKIWTQSPPVAPDQYYQHFEIWTATSAVMEDPGILPTLASFEAADAWYQVWGTGGFVFANEDLALNLARRPEGKLIAAACGTRRIPGCVVRLTAGGEAFHLARIDVDPAKPWKTEVPAPEGDLAMEVIAPDGGVLARHELRAGEEPREAWTMPATPRWHGGLPHALYDEIYSTLWRRRGHFLDGAIDRYKRLLAETPDSAARMLDLARALLKDARVRDARVYPEPGPQAEADAAARRRADLETAEGLLRKLIERDPEDARARFYRGIALEPLGRRGDAVAEFSRALAGKVPEPAAGLYLARHLIVEDPRRALACARTAAGAYPQSLLAKQMLLVSLQAAGETGEAVAVGGIVRSIDPADPLTAAILAGDPEARAHLESDLDGPRP